VERIDFAQALAECINMVATAEPITKAAEPKRPSIPLAARLKAKNLYVYRDATHQQIAKETGLTVGASEMLAHREGWPKLKREREKAIESRSDARAEEGNLAIVEAVAGQAEEIVLSGLDRARDAVKRKGKDAAKNFQSWTGGIRNLVSAIKTIRAKDGSLPDSGPTSFNLFFVGVAAPSAAQAEPKSVEPIEVKQVTD